MLVQIRDYYRDNRDRGGPGEYQWVEEQNLENSSEAFSALCGFLTVLYAGFAVIVFLYANTIIQENAADAKDEMGYEREYSGSQKSTGKYISPESAMA